MISVRAYAKINLSLELLRERADGFTEIRTVFQSIDLHDELKLEDLPSGRIEVSSSDPAVPGGPGNLVWQAASLVQRKASPGRGVRISIRKSVPAGAGLGGGSSDAAAALVATDRLWGAELRPADLHELAASIGSDVPFFLHGGTALGLGRGEEIHQLPDLPPVGVLVALPSFRLSTAEVYARAKRRLTPREGGRSIGGFATRIQAGDRDYSWVFNELEPAASEDHEDLPALRREFVEGGAAAAALCGSGSAVFGLFPSEEDINRMDSIARAVAGRWPGVKVYRSRTLGADVFRSSLYGISND